MGLLNLLGVTLKAPVGLPNFRVFFPIVAREILRGVAEAEECLVAPLPLPLPQNRASLFMSLMRIPTRVSSKFQVCWVE